MQLPDGSGDIKGIVCGVCGLRFSFSSPEEGMEAIKHALAHGAVPEADALERDPLVIPGRC